MKKNLKLPAEMANTIYEEQDEAGKQLLRKIWPGHFAPVDIKELVKTWEDACIIKGIHPVNSLPFLSPESPFQEAINAVAQAWIIRDVLCEGWEPDYTNADQYKYEPRYYDFKPGFGFSRTYYVIWFTFTTVGSRLVFPTSDLALYFASQFLHISNKYLTKPTNTQSDAN